MTRRPRPAPATRPTPGEPDDLAELARIAGEPVRSTERSRWGFSNRTDLVTLAGGRRLVVQRLEDRGAALHRLRLARLLPPRLALAGVPTARFVRGDATTAPPFAIWQPVGGTPGPELIDDPATGPALATAMGALVRRVAAVPTAALRLPATWSDPGRLAAAAGGWLERLEPALDDATRLAAEAAIERFAADPVGRPTVLAHGDFAPANVLAALDKGQVRITALVDLEFARLADPLFDIAWWDWVVRFHHPSAWPHLTPPFRSAAGVPDDAETAGRIHAIQVLRGLEVAAVVAGRDATVARTWAERLSVTASWAPDRPARGGTLPLP